MDEALQTAATTAFPERTVDAIEPQTSRPGNEVGYVTFVDAPPLYLKVATDTTQRLARETAATRYAGRRCSIEVPDVLAADLDAEPPYLALSPLPGTPLNDPWTGEGDRKRLVRQAGHLLAGVHEARFEAAGTITGEDSTRLGLVPGTWTETLCRTVEWRAEDWFPDRFADIPDRLTDTIREIDPSVEGKPVLLHADCSRINVHLDPEGLLDWERALVGDPAFDLVDTAGHLFELQPDVEEEREPELRAAFHDGYPERAGPLPDGLERWRPLYRAINHLLVPQVFEEWAVEAEPPTDDLAADVREAFDDRLSNAREALA